MAGRFIRGIILYFFLPPSASNTGKRIDLLLVKLTATYNQEIKRNDRCPLRQSLKEREGEIDRKLRIRQQVVSTTVKCLAFPRVVSHWPFFITGVSFIRPLERYALERRLCLCEICLRSVLTREGTITSRNAKKREISFGENDPEISLMDNSIHPFLLPFLSFISRSSVSYAS